MGVFCLSTFSQILKRDKVNYIDGNYWNTEEPLRMFLDCSVLTEKCSGTFVGFFRSQSSKNSASWDIMDRNSLVMVFSWNSVKINKSQTTLMGRPQWVHTSVRNSSGTFPAFPVSMMESIKSSFLIHRKALCLSFLLLFCSSSEQSEATKTDSAP